jgi:hypothetical protein
MGSSRPAALTCPSCGAVTPYELDEHDEWVLDGEFWHDRALGISYADTWRCLRALQLDARARRHTQRRGQPE